MTNQLRALGESRRWRLMVDAAKRAVEEQGVQLERKPGRGLSNMWEVRRAGQAPEVVSIRTSMDRWFAFPPLEKGTKWKTLDEADTVVVAAVNDKENPTAVEVYEFPADEVRKRFNASHAARLKAGMTVKDNFGMWVGLDKHNRGVPADVGSGLREEYPPIAVYPLAELLERAAASEEEEEVEPPADQVLEATADDSAALTERQQQSAPAETIAEVIRNARERIARIAGLTPEAVKLELKLEL